MLLWTFVIVAALFLLILCFGMYRLYMADSFAKAPAPKPLVTRKANGIKTKY